MIAVRRLRFIIFAPLLILSLAMLLYTQPVRSAGEPLLSVDSAAGEAGQIVSVSVSIRDLDLPKGGGISGGQFELAYNPAIAVVENIIKGRLLDSGFMFLHNQNFSPDKIRIAWASQSGLITGDGSLCTIAFKLSSAAAVTPSIHNLVLYDQDLQPLKTIPMGGNNYAFLLRFSGIEQPPIQPSGIEGEEVTADDEEETAEQPTPETSKKIFPAGFFHNPALLSIPVALVLGGFGIVFFRRRRRRKANRTRKSA